MKGKFQMVEKQISKFKTNLTDKQKGTTSYCVVIFLYGLVRQK